MRERRPDAAAGILLSAVAAHAEKVQQAIAAAEWPELVEQVRSGPPVWSPARLASVDRIVNTVEFFVHHEDVRRASEEWDERELDAELEDRLYWGLSKMAKRLVRSSEVGIVLQPTGGRPPVTLKEASPSVTAAGPVGELVMFVYGRQNKSNVDVAGDDDAVEAVRTASFGV
jgi:uncharacterized protein (TIGR03085 family)